MFLTDLAHPWWRFSIKRRLSKIFFPSTNHKHESDCRAEASFHKRPNLTRVLFPFRSSTGMPHRREGNMVTRQVQKGKLTFESFGLLLIFLVLFLLSFLNCTLNGFTCFVYYRAPARAVLATWVDKTLVLF